MKKNTSYTIKRARRLPVILIGEGLLVGAAGGLVVLLYRLALTFAGDALNRLLALIEGDPLRTAGWFAVLVLRSQVYRMVEAQVEIVGFIILGLLALVFWMFTGWLRKGNIILRFLAFAVTYVGYLLFLLSMGLQSSWEASSVFWADCRWEERARPSSSGR